MKYKWHKMITEKFPLKWIMYSSSKRKDNTAFISESSLSKDSGEVLKIGS
jgi:hypothetical protein